jgi:hypothetical protein
LRANYLREQSERVVSAFVKLVRGVRSSAAHPTGADKRHSITRITRDGLRLLERIDIPMQQAFDEVASRLGARDCRALSRLCELLYDFGAC